MLRWLFNLFYLQAAALLWPWFLYKYLTTGKYRAGLGQRLGRLPRRESSRQSIWIHAVSVGELLQTRPLIEALRKRHPDLDIVVTYTTRTAAAIAQEQLADVYHCYSPIDLSWVVAKFFRVLNPRLLILMELELWPNWLMHAARKRVPVLLVNGRIGDRSFRNYRRGRFVMQRAYDAVSHWGMQDATYTERARALAPDGEVSEVGNLKYDSLQVEPDAAQVEEFRTLFNMRDQDVLVCGSTHPGEHEAIVEMIPQLAERGLRVVIVPRHPERHESVRKMLDEAGIPRIDRSKLTASQPAARDAVILLDTVGELAAVYGVADLVFVGGSLIPHGGQNMAEPTALGKCTLFGPHTDNFRATVRDLLACEGAVQVRDAAELRREIYRLLADPDGRKAFGERGRDKLLASRGALDRYLALAEGLMDGTR